MLVIIKHNDNSLQTAMFEVSGILATSQLFSYYAKLYMNLEIQAYQIEDDYGRVVKFGGSI